jgi:hypothetical protein
MWEDGAGMGDATVIEGVCRERHKNVDANFERDERRLNSHAEDISELKSLTVEISALTKQLVEDGKKRDIQQIEDNKKRDAKLQELSDKPGKRYETIITGIIMGVIGVAIGIIASKIF